jgi:hypothetical protein
MRGWEASLPPISPLVCRPHWRYNTCLMTHGYRFRVSRGEPYAVSPVSA